MPLTIEYAHEDSVCFRVHGVIHYLRIKPEPSRLYDQNLNQLVVPNIDSWFQSKTNQRYSFRTVCDMAEAFKSGLHAAYVYDDLRQISELCLNDVLDELFKFGMAAEYTSTCWIELATPTKIDKIVNFFNLRLDDLRNDMGDDGVHALLCRILAICKHKSLNQATIVKKLFDRINMETEEPNLPDISKLHDKVKQRVRSKVFGKNEPKYKKISDDVIKKTHGLVKYEP